MLENGLNILALAHFPKFWNIRKNENFEIKILLYLKNYTLFKIYKNNLI